MTIIFGWPQFIFYLNWQKLKVMDNLRGIGRNAESNLNMTVPSIDKTLGESVKKSETLPGLQNNAKGIHGIQQDFTGITDTCSKL